MERDDGFTPGLAGTARPATRLVLDTLRPGQPLGTTRDVVDARFLALWRRVHPTDSDDVPLAVVNALTMRAYLRVVPRPAGNIHAKLRVTAGGELMAGEPLVTTVSFKDAQVRNGRRYVDFATETVGPGDRLILAGDISIVWADG